MNLQRALICATALTLASGPSLAHLVAETCYGRVGTVYRLHCYIGYTEPDDQEHVQLILAQCKMSYPYFGMVGPYPPINILVNAVPQRVTAQISAGVCPEGIYAWHPRAYLDFIGTNPPPDAWHEYPEGGDEMTFVCYL